MRGDGAGKGGGEESDAEAQEGKDGGEGIEEAELGRTLKIRSHQQM